MLRPTQLKNKINHVEKKKEIGGVVLKKIIKNSSKTIN